MMLPFLLLLLLFWPPGARPCHTATYSTCKNTPFVPGHNLVGEGFDVVKLEATGAAVVDVKTYMDGGEHGNCTVCQNQLLNKIQKLPASVQDWRVKVLCQGRLSSKTMDSSQSVLKETSDSLQTDWKVGLGLSGLGGVALGGSHSKASTFAQSHSKADQFSFMSHDVKCLYYTFRLHSRPPLSKEFKDSLQKLPKNYNHQNEEAFRNFISVYGTHFIRRVHLGGKVHSLTAVRTCQASLSKLSTHTISKCLSVEASAVIKGVEVSGATKYCNDQGKKLGHDHSFGAAFSDRSVEVLGGDSSVGEVLFNPQGHEAYKKWLHSLKSVPGLVDYHIRSLHQLVTDDAPLRSSLRSAIKQYIISQATSLKCPASCKIGVQSPSCSCRCHGNSLVNSDCCPTEVGIAHLTMTVVKGEGLYGDTGGTTDAYVKVAYGNEGITTKVIWDNDFPKWNYKIRFGAVNLSHKTELKIEVWDRDNGWNDDLLGKVAVIPTSGKDKKWRLKLNHGYIHITTSAECGPKLQGELCDHYNPGPSGYRDVMIEAGIKNKAKNQKLELDQEPDQGQGSKQGVDQNLEPKPYEEEEKEEAGMILHVSGFEGNKL